MQVKERALEIAKAMENEDGATGAVGAFYKHFPSQRAACEAEASHHRKRFSVRQCFVCS